MSSSHAEELEALLRSSQGLGGPDLKLALTRLSSEVKDRAQRGSLGSYDFFASTVDALSKIKGPAYADLRFHCILESGLFFYRIGHFSSSFQTSRLLDNLAPQAGGKRALRRAETFAGIVNAEAGNVAEAVVRHTNALRLTRELDEANGEAACFINLSVAFNYGGLYSEARACGRRALQLAEQDSHSGNLLASACTNLAQTLLYQEQYEKGFELIQRAIDASSEADLAATAYSRTARELTYVQLALELGKLARAREHSHLCRKYSRWGDNPRCRVAADIAEGLCEISGGSVERGLLQLESALSHSTDYALRIDALGALAKAFDQVGQPDKALLHMQDLLSSVRAVRQQVVSTLFPNATSSEVSDYGLETNAPATLELREARLRVRTAEMEVLNSKLEMLERLAVTADLKEEASGEHGYRVGKLASVLGAELGWSPESCGALDVAARLHDIGKIGVPDRILLNSERLKEAERHFMSTHAVIGAELLANSNISHLRLAEEIARYHHEWWDGSGYPSKLAGKRIPIHARIVALADVFDALTHGRPYAEPWSMDRALEEIRSRRGTQFDPELTDRFLVLIQRLREKHADLDAYLGKAGRNSPFLQARNKIRLMLEEERENERKATVAGNETRH